MIVSISIPRYTSILAAVKCLAIRVYISEARNAAIIAQLRALAETSSHGSKLVDVFSDIAYNRTSLTLTAALADDLVESAVSIVGKALSTITVTQHEGSHPRIGTVDHISCHDLSSVLQGTTTVGRVTEASISLAQQLSYAIAQLGPSTYLYGQANSRNMGLAQLRRHLGYFEPTVGQAGTWQGYTPVKSSCVPAHHGSAEALHGVCCLGAVKWVTNYNVKLLEVGVGTTAVTIGSGMTMYASQAADVARGAILARGVRRPRLVEALSLPHGDGVEVAMNLLDADDYGPDQAMASLTVGACTENASG